MDLMEELELQLEHLVREKAEDSYLSISDLRRWTYEDFSRFLINEFKKRGNK